MMPESLMISGLVPNTVDTDPVASSSNSRGWGSGMGWEAYPLDGARSYTSFGSLSSR
jgi:hypothetical protein